MNGLVELFDGENKHVLRFGYPACMEFEVRCFPKDRKISPNLGKINVDLIYSGLLGEAVRNDKPIPEYGVAYDLHDAVAEQSDYSDQIQRVWDTYHASKWGADFKARMEEFSKKKAQGK